MVAFGLDSRQQGSTAEDGVEETRRALKNEGLPGHILEADVNNNVDVENVMQTVIKKFGLIDGLVNNAGIRPIGSILDTHEAIFDRVVEVNLRGQSLMCKAAIKLMKG